MILHHYWGSPYAEKIRLLFGYKHISWRSLEIPAIPPRPSLQPVLGDFRRTPVLQVGADFFCDTRLIAAAIDRLHPHPPLNANHNRAISELLCGWVEPRVFVMTGPVRFESAEDVNGVFSGTVDPRSFQQDRVPFMQPAIDATHFADMRASAAEHLGAYLAIIEDLLTQQRFIGGEQPCAADFSAYHLVWWLRTPPARMGLLETVPRVNEWADRLAAFGHGNFVPATAADSIHAIANGSEGVASIWSHIDHPWLGRHVQVRADDYGRDPIAGKLVAASVRNITLARTTKYGAVRIHFPRLGYELTTI